MSWVVLLGCFLAGVVVALLAVYCAVHSVARVALRQAHRSHASAQDYHSYVSSLLEAAPVKAHEISGHFRLALSPEGRKTAATKYGTIKANILFVWSTEEDETGRLERTRNAPGTVNLDGVQVELAWTLTRKGILRPQWSYKNGLRLSHPERPVVPKTAHTSCVLFLPTGHELERWWMALREASVMKAAVSSTRPAGAARPLTWLRHYLTVVE
eukprot:RCo052172